jgi:hypothetical protein
VLGTLDLAITHDGGQNWTTLPLPSPASSVADVSVLPSETVAASVDASGEALDLDTYDHATGQWQQRRVSVGAPIAWAHIVDNDGALAGIMVTAASSSNFSEGTWLSTPDGGAIWHQDPVPAGGDVTAAGGKLWLTGGVGNAEIYSSGDQGASWQHVNVPTRAGASRPLAFGPVQSTPGGVVLTATDSRESHVITGSSSGSGWQWTNGPVLDLGGEYAPGTPAVSSAADGVLWVLSPLDQIARVTLSTGQVSTATANGLPANGSIDLHATSATTAWTDYSTTTCQGKSNCVDQGGIVATTDGGATWNPVSAPTTG